MTRREAIAHRDKMDVSLYASVWIEGIPDQESEEKIDEKFSDFKENPDELESKPVTMEDNIDELNKIINIVK